MLTGLSFGFNGAPCSISNLSDHPRNLRTLMVPDGRRGVTESPQQRAATLPGGTIGAKSFPAEAPLRMQDKQLRGCRHDLLSETRPH